MTIRLRPFRPRRPVSALGLVVVVAFVLFTYVYWERLSEFQIQSSDQADNKLLHSKSHEDVSVRLEPPDGSLSDKSPDAGNQGRAQIAAPNMKVDSGLPTEITKEEISGGEPTDKNVAELRNQVRKMMKHAWDSYTKYAWGSNELRPLTKSSNQPNVLGQSPLGATIVDSLDTLYIMGLTKEFESGRDWIRKSLTITKRSMVSLFEFNIRFIGGLLSVYTFTLDKVFLDKAVEIAHRLLPAFNTPTGIPKSLIDLVTHESKNFVWSVGYCSILSEVGTLHMEFTYLSELTGDPVYAQKVQRIREHIVGLPLSNGLYFNHLSHEKSAWCSHEAGLAGLGDSFYEYLLKESIRNPKDVQARRMYNASMDALWKNRIFSISPRNKLLYVGNYKYGRVEPNMEHLACFVGGMLAVGTYPDVNNVWFHRGESIAETCHQSYISSATHLGPEKFSFTSEVEAVAIQQSNKHYLLRPETVETYFYLWRYTKNQKYRDWAADVVQALKKYTQTANGFSGIRDVYSSSPDLDDVQQSYFLAETLKYLYLIFSEDTLLPLDRWVFNTEAHPLPVHGKVSLGNSVWT